MKETHLCYKNMDAEYIKVARVNDLHAQRGKLVVVDGEDIALFNREGRIYAIHNVCAHQHFSKLHEGEIDRLAVTCPMHGWTYDLLTGKAINGDGRVRTYNVRVEGNDVYVEVQKRADSS